MRNIFTFSSIVLSIIFLVVGYLYRDKKINASFNSNKESFESQAQPNSATINLSPHWPEEASETFEQNFMDGEEFKFAIVGSDVLGQETGGWSTMLKETMNDAYGEDVIEFEIFEFDMRSDEFMKERYVQKVVEFAPDLVLFEPFKLRDYGVVSTEDNHDHISAFHSKLTVPMVNLRLFYNHRTRILTKITPFTPAMSMI